MGAALILDGGIAAGPVVPLSTAATRASSPSLASALGGRLLLLYQGVPADLRDGPRIQIQTLTGDLPAADGGMPAFVSQPSTHATCLVPYRYSESGVPEVSGNSPRQFVLLAGPGGLTADTITGELRWVPTRGQMGAQSVLLRVQNASGSVDQSFTINVACKNPEPFSIGCSSADLGALGLGGVAVLWAVFRLSPRRRKATGQRL